METSPVWFPLRGLKSVELAGRRRMMEADTGLKERRAHKRFKAKNCTIAVRSKLGAIIDISMGGLSFSYIDTGEWPKDVPSLAIIFGADDLCLDEFPLRVISDCSLSKGMSMMHRCGVQFGELSRKQLSQLEHFIWVNSMLEHELRYSE